MRFLLRKPNASINNTKQKPSRQYMSKQPLNLTQGILLC